MASEDQSNNPAPLVAAGQLMAERKLFGLVWIDNDLIVKARYGPLVEFAEIDVSIVDTLLPLAGMETELTALQQDADQVFHIPAVAPVINDTDTTRLNLTFFWSASDQQYLLLVATTQTGKGLEQELSKQMRARLIAEAEVAEKSRALSKANSELEQANFDLEQYAAIISHDLKAPLRGMRYIAEDIAQAIKIGDNDSSLTKVKELQDQSLRMSQMMTALLDYASVGRKSEVIELVDTRALINTVVNTLSHARQLSVNITGDWPTIETLRAPLDLVIRNLVDNAIKHHDRDNCCINIMGAITSPELIITIEDDGPGIDPKHHAAILLPFRRLSSHRNEGSGMGLALIKRTIATLGGSIEIHSDPTIKRGSQFIVRWPINSETAAN